MPPDPLMQLPKDMLSHIFHMICNFESSQVTIKFLLALHVCSKALAAECNIATVNLMLHPDYKDNNSKYLLKLTDSANLTVCMPPSAGQFL